MPSVDLTPRLARESKPGAKDTILFDKTLPGFGLRIHPSGRKVYIVQARIEGRSRRIVIARHGEMELAEARRRARDMLGRIHAGENPAEDIRREKETPTLREFADEYLRRCDPHWKPSGRKTVRIYLKARILPAFGKMPLDRIGPEDVAAWFDAASKDRPGAANRAFEILRAMMFRAEEWGSREPGSNPCLGIGKNPRNNIARFLDTDELARLGRALDGRESEWPEAVAAIRLLALTGCRRSEVLNLRWRDIGAGAINLPDSKTGPRAVALGEAPRARIAALPGSRRRSCFPVTPKAGASTASPRTGGRCAPMPGSAGCACTTCGTPRPARPSCRARTCRSSANCSGTGATAQRRATPTLPTGTWSTRRRRSEPSSPAPWMVRHRRPTRRYRSPAASTASSGFERATGPPGARIVEQSRGGERCIL